MKYNDIMIHIETCDFTTVDKKNWYANDFVPLVSKLYFIKKGSAKLIIDNQSFIIEENSLVLIPLRTKQTFYLETDKMTHYYCHFTLPVGHHLDYFDLKEVGIISHLDNPNKVIKLFDVLIKDFKNISDLFHRKEALMKLLDLHMNHSDKIRDKVLDPNIQSLNRITTYINDNLHLQHTTSDLAAMMNVHPNYFIRLFKKHYGMPPIKYINTLRINTAIQHLLYSTKTVTEISQLLGFSDVFYFSKLFKKYTGKTPIFYRKKN
ncbi:helix-turn-helix domain-containing protein [Acidaminobacter sp. JC074]|uniref:helix-turn-helix domain-containing protein n=1 Tax=Acidaminobacter sp. JC074 TaxID=2530199 RepID=UPI001F112900|nr:AraC family transcriptional regulator [Acidaminobacter sp. JC074]MCH4888870.1 helix-turn-helix domain-containing protein [Acidaminobacter sp. JC074]